MNKNLQTFALGGKATLRRPDQWWEMLLGCCVPLGALFAVKTTAVISPNTGEKAIIIEHQHALRVHTHAHTRTKAQTQTA